MIRIAVVGRRDVGQYERAVERLSDVRIVAGVERFLPEHRGKCDAVIVDAALESQSALATQAAKAGKHVLVTTPMARTIEDADALIASCEAAGVRLMVGGERRFLPAVEEIRERLNAGLLGVPGLLRMHRWEPKEKPRAGASLAEIDLACWLFDSIPTHVYATSREGDSGCYLQVHFGFPNGGMALIDFACTLKEGKGYFSLSLIGSSGAAYADDHHNTHLLFGGGDPKALVSDQQRGCLTAQIEELGRAVREDRQPVITGEDGRAVLLVRDAVEESISSGRAVEQTGGIYASV